MKIYILFFIISQIILGNQTHVNEDSASVPVHVNVFVTHPSQQLKIVNENGTEENSIVINHFLSPDFQGENVEITNFYVQRGTGIPEHTLSPGVMEVVLSEDIALSGRENDALNVNISVDETQIETKDGQARIKNTITSKVSRNPQRVLMANDEYSATTNLNVIWKKN